MMISISGPKCMCTLVQVEAFLSSGKDASASGFQLNLIIFLVDVVKGVTTEE